MVPKFLSIALVAVSVAGLPICASAQNFTGGGFSGGGNFGSRAMGSGSVSGSGPIGQAGFTTGGASGAVGDNAFLVDQSASSGFVGRDSEDTRQFFSALGDAQQSFLEDLGLQPRERNATSSGSRPPLVRITLKVAFDTPEVSVGAVASAVENRFLRSLQNRVASPGITLNGRTAILTGQTESEYEKLVAEKMLLLEPGVSRVENRLTVVPR